MLKSTKQENSPENRIKFWDYLTHYDRHRKDILALVDQVFSSGRLILGSRVTEFENRFAAYCDARYGVGVNSCTDALFLALKAIGIAPGDEVITVANTAVPTVAAIRATGAIPVFVDVNLDTALMDVTGVESAITSKTRCILPVHLFGQAVEMEPLTAVAKTHKLHIVEDCAQATGAVYQGKRVGSFGAIGAFSFYPTKVLGAFGDGGMAVTSDEELYRRLKRLRFYGMDGNYYAEEEGYNSRLDELQAAILDYRLDTLDADVVRRGEIAAIYVRELGTVQEIELLSPPSEGTHQYYLFNIRTTRRSALIKHLLDAGIETKINYPDPIHLMRGYSFLGYRPGALPNTERLAGEILSLPMYPELLDHEVVRVCEAIRSFFRN